MNLRIAIKRLLFSVVTGCLAAGPASACPRSAPQYRLAYASQRSQFEFSAVYLMDADGTHQERLTINDGENVNPACSPDGAYLAFLGGEGLQVADHTLTTVQYITTDVMIYGGISLSERADKVAFVRADASGNRDIYLINGDGTGLLRLTTHPGIDTSPTLSPDGTRVAFSSNRDGSHNDRDIYVMYVDGSNLTRLTFTGGFNINLAWSPDGTRMAFAREIPGGDGLNIFVMDADGANVTQLTHNTFRLTAYPAWSPDGTQIAFASRLDNDEASEIYIMDADGSHMTRLTQDDFDDSHPCWLLDIDPDPTDEIDSDVPLP